MYFSLRQLFSGSTAVLCAVNLNDVLACKDYWEVKGEQTTADMNKLEDGINQLKDNEEAYLDGLDAVADGEEALAKGEADYAAGQATLAQGEAESIRLTYEAQATGLKYLSQANIQESVLRLRGIDALKDVADGRATKIFMPTDLSDVVSVIGAIGETLGVGDAEPIDKSSEPVPAPPTDPCHGDSASKITQEINAQKREAWLQQNTRG